VTQRRFFAVIH